MSIIIIGIDLGMTSCCVGLKYRGQINCIQNTYGNYTTPCHVAFVGEDILFGEEAKNQEGINPNNTIFDFQRFLAKSCEEISVQEDRPRWPFMIYTSGDGIAKVRVLRGRRARTFSSEELTGIFLNKIIAMVQAKIGREVNGIVITIPADFQFAQRIAIRRAANSTGIPFIKVMSEPVAAAVAYGLPGSNKNKSPYTLVINIGGRTMNVTLLLCEAEKITEISTSGLPHLGGENFTKRMVGYFIQEINEKFNIDITNDRIATCKLRNACELAKESLSRHTEARVDAGYLINENKFSGHMSRKLFEAINEDLFCLVTKPIYTTLRKAGMELSEIHSVILVGGSSNIPKIQQIIKDCFPEATISDFISREEAVARGAAIQGAKLAAGEFGGFQGMIINEVMPLSLGIKWSRELISEIVPQNTQVPVRLQKQFTTKKDSQMNCRISVYEGNSPLCTSNDMLTTFHLSGIQPKPARKTRIDVHFCINDDMSVKVTASEIGSDISETRYVYPELNAASERVRTLQRRADVTRSDDTVARTHISARLDFEKFCITYRSYGRRLEGLTGNEQIVQQDHLSKLNYALNWIFRHPREKLYIYRNRMEQLEKYCEPLKDMYKKRYHQNQLRE